MGLTVTYGAMLVVGITAFITGVPAFNIAAPEWWASAWGVAVTVAAAISAVGSLSERKGFQRVEIVGASLLFVALFSYAITLLYLAANDPSRTPLVGVVTLALGVQPAVRLLWLMSRTFKRRV